MITLLETRCECNRTWSRYDLARTARMSRKFSVKSRLFSSAHEDSCARQCGGTCAPDPDISHGTLNFWWRDAANTRAARNDWRHIGPACYLILMLFYYRNYLQCYSTTGTIKSVKNAGLEREIPGACSFANFYSSLLSPLSPFTLLQISDFNAPRLAGLPGPLLERNKL